MTPLEELIVLAKAGSLTPRAMDLIEQALCWEISERNGAAAARRANGRAYLAQLRSRSSPRSRISRFSTATNQASR